MKKLTLFFFLFSFLLANGLTKEEKEYLKKNNVVRFCIDPDWVPIEFKDEDGEAEGISIDILKNIAKKLNIKLEYVKTSSWAQTQKFLKEKKCDVLPTAIITNERKKYAIFTKPYLSYKLAVITKNDKPLVNSLDEIVNKTMSRKKGSGLIPKLKKVYPNIKIVQTNGVLEAFRAVENDKVYFTMAVVPIFEYYKRKYHFNDLVFNGYTKFGFDLRMQVRNDKPILRDILNKSLNLITPKMRKEIYEKWAINVKPKIEYKKYIIIISSILLLIILILLYQHYYLRKKIKEITKEIKEKNEKFKRIMNNAMEAVIISDENLLIVDGNKTAEKIFGYKLEEVKGKSLLEFTPKDEQNELFNNYERLEPVEIVRKRKDGSQIVCLATRTFYTENSKKYRVSMLVDITKFKKQEEMLAQQSKSVAMGEMIGNIAHQWRQPLNALSLYISNLVLDYEFKELNDEKIKEFEEHTTKLIQGMSQTINDFTEFLKPDKIKKEFSLIECLNDSIKFIEASYKTNEIEIENNIKKDIKLFGVKSELEQVFMNIFNNSKDAFKERKIENRKVIISAKEKENQIIIVFRDNAGGVDEKIIHRLTEPYFSTKFASHGTGLGLYMSDMIIRNTFKGELIMKNVDGGLETQIIIENKK